MYILFYFMIGLSAFIGHFGIWMVAFHFDDRIGKKTSLKQTIFEHSVLILLYIITISIGKLLVEGL